MDFSAPRGPTYLEAYPAIEAAEVLREWRRGHSWCIWRDESGWQAGIGCTNFTSPTTLTLRYELVGTAYLAAQQGFAELRVEYTRAGSSRRAVFRCPACEIEAAKLFLKETQFECRHCSGLTNRSATLSHRQCATERLDEIDAIVGQGRPPGMRNASYHALTDERTRILRQLDGARSRPPAGKRFKITLGPWAAEPPWKP